MQAALVTRTITSRSQAELIRLRFKKHKLAVVSLWILGLYMIFILFGEFLVPNDPVWQFANKVYVSPRPIRFIDETGRFHLRPFMYRYEEKLDEKTWQRIWSEVRTPEDRLPIRLFVRGFEYRLLGIIPARVHLFGLEDAEETPLFIFGTDKSGRDIFSRSIFATRVSMSIAFLGVTISLLLGVIFGGISGYYGGIFDEIVQRSSELLLAIPKLPLWMGLAAAVPGNWPVIKVYIVIAIIVSLMSWPWLARGIRSKLISLRQEDYVLAARSYSSSSMRIIFRYLVPNFVSYIIVSVTLAAPGMILLETALSFLGLGLRPPAVSWGVLLEQAQNFQTVLLNPWLLIPGLFVIVVILALNFVGDGLRDAADPFEKG
jgi:peptide/nickel transport system permease protein